MFLERLKENNQYPIIFIGSGITQRYFKDAPTWENLLQKLWNEIHPEDEYFSLYHHLENQGKSEFDIQTEIAEKLDNDYTDAFFAGKIELPGISKSEVHSQKLSPFRRKITHIFSNLTPRPETSHELDSFTKMLSKSRMIITTNYDSFLEDRLANQINIHIGNKGLFQPSTEFGELFKIHGSVSNPESIVISSKDYGEMSEASTLINAKILSNLTEAPIIFLGYSISDENIRGLLRDFSKNLDLDILDAANRIAVVEYKKDVTTLNEVVSEISDLDVHYTKISTDNFKEIYNNISSVDQGISPHEISKYQAMFKKIIEVNGQKGELDTVLTSYVNVNKLPTKIKDKNIIVAFGTRDIIIKIPSTTEYLHEYFFEEKHYPVEIMLSAIARSATSATLPIKKVIDNANTHGFQKDLVSGYQRLHRSISEKKQYKTDGTIGRQNTIILDKLKSNDPKIIFECNLVKLRPKMFYIIKNIKRFDRDKLMTFTRYLLEEALPSGDKVDTPFRKFFTKLSVIDDNVIANLKD